MWGRTLHLGTCSLLNFRPRIIEGVRVCVCVYTSYVYNNCVRGVRVCVCVHTSYNGVYVYTLPMLCGCVHTSYIYNQGFIDSFGEEGMQQPNNIMQMHPHILKIVTASYTVLATSNCACI